MKKHKVRLCKECNCELEAGSRYVRCEQCRMEEPDLVTIISRPISRRLAEIPSEDDDEEYRCAICNSPMPSSKLDDNNCCKSCRSEFNLKEE